MKGHRPASRVRLKQRGVWDRLDQMHMSQNEMAHEVGITSGYLSQLMSGTRCPSAEMRQRLQEVLGIDSFDDLFSLEVVQ